MSNSNIRGRSAQVNAPAPEPKARRHPEREQSRPSRAADEGWGNDTWAAAAAEDDPYRYDATDDKEAAPPLRGKVHPRREISDVVPTLDDEVRRYHHHPNDAGSTEFEVNPDAADAAADLASDLGSEFLEGATRGQDISDVVMSHEDSDGDLPYLLEDEELDPGASISEESDEDDEDDEDDKDDE